MSKTPKFALLVLLLICAAAICGPALLPSEYSQLSSNQFATPSWQHPFGTDLNGRDLLYRVLEGARISLLVGICAASVSLFIGTSYGLISGFAGGKIDSLMMRLLEILQSVPRLIIILVLINAFDAHFKQWIAQKNLLWLIGYSRIVILVVALGFIEWLTMARIVRGQVLVLKEQQFVLAARSLGQSNWKIICKHLLPNLTGVIVVYLTLTIPAVILDESFLSFLGLGIQAPQSSWGTLLSDGAQVINPLRSNWWLLVCPALVMSTTLLSLNLIGDALRDLLDPRKG